MNVATCRSGEEAPRTPRASRGSEDPGGRRRGAPARAEGGRLKRAITPATVALLVVVFAVVNVCVLVLRRERVEHEHFVVPSFIPVIGVAISIALLTQIEPATYARAAILVALGAVLWIVNWLILRRQGAPAATAPPST